MIHPPNWKVEEYRVVVGPMGSDISYKNNGMFIIPNTLRKKSPDLRVLISDGLEWDHVSVSLPGRCPWWDEMCYIKDLFFTHDEVVVQFHPREADYVNCHEFCLHLWRSQTVEQQTPPPDLIGPGRKI